MHHAFEIVSSQLQFCEPLPLRCQPCRPEHPHPMRALVDAPESAAAPRPGVLSPLRSFSDQQRAAKLRKSVQQNEEENRGPCRMARWCTGVGGSGQDLA